MSNIYITEPPTTGKVCMKTSVGDIDIELWAKECPKACRNFIQLALEGYFDDTIFFRVVKDFIVQGGDPSGTGAGGESIYDNEPFRDEFHSRLKFNRRGLVGLANAGKNDNRSQFFFTMGPTPELQNKHTLFGKVTGTTIFNMLKLQEGAVDHNERPELPKRLISIDVLKNPFDDIVPREVKKKVVVEEVNKFKSKSKATKDFKLLSFGDEAEEDEMDLDEALKKDEFQGKSKSLPGLIEKEEIVNQSKSNEFKKAKRKMQIKNDDQDEDMENKVDALYKKTEKQQTSKYSLENDDNDVSSEDEYSEEKKKMEKARKEIEELKKEVYKQRVIGKMEKEKEDEQQNDPVLIQFRKENEKYVKTTITNTKNREQKALEMLAKFKKKLQSNDSEPSTSWLKHKLKVEEEDDEEKVVLAKDANLKNDAEWLDIHDPKNPLNQKRREMLSGADPNLKKKTKRS